LHRATGSRVACRKRVGALCVPGVAASCNSSPLRGGLFRESGDACERVAETPVPKGAGEEDTLAPRRDRDGRQARQNNSRSVRLGWLARAALFFAGGGCAKVHPPLKRKGAAPAAWIRRRRIPPFVFYSLVGYSAHGAGTKGGAPYGGWQVRAGYPALTRWANEFRPSGSCSLSSRAHGARSFLAREVFRFHARFPTRLTNVHRLGDVKITFAIPSPLFFPDTRTN
jgi:hypothetical protein